ncbi:uncharacterized protein CTHT_0025570 [Thermochaetoides thermophila DSM 1495]|uniref:Conserved oligomeric Golgi complex subunit 1 n=1 Tax=Chaetomium thermophilum (strain DSM 1495 / CBS 144.50 / IMI 039719) TaxID=759272 RepID=G0S605_CHATD|nr:hypothetical protein CTHT_0025570 [Thermochaetoides thermophila DSM 1495]EGS20721.1 hypothetical protein CTHT_0025570 [Thermochaetoides thermophila DSM 1495]
MAPTATTLPQGLDIALLRSSHELFSTAPFSALDPTSTTSSTSTTPVPPSKHLPGQPYTLPQIRAIHAALQTRAADIQSRLRTQVGASYRDLLGTADTIVAMRTEMDKAVGLLGAMGARCGAGVVSEKVKGLKEFTAAHAGKNIYGGKDLGVAAREKLLAGCLLGLREILGGGSYKADTSRKKKKSGDELLRAARLYVLAKLLVQSLSGTGSTDAASARKSLENVHSPRLRSHIAAVLRSASDGPMRCGDVLKALGAHSLAETAGARDVLRYFLRVRSEAIALALDVNKDEDDGNETKQSADVTRALGLYAKTLLDVQSLVPKQLPDALHALKQDRLLENSLLKDMECLRLDIYKQWCGDEIQFYIPFIRHDDLEPSQAREMLLSWARSGSEVLLKGLNRTLERMTELKAIVELRTNVLKLWVAEGSKVRGIDQSTMLNELREVINNHMLRVLEAKVSKLRLVGSEVAATLSSWREGVTDQHTSLWDDVTALDTDLTTPNGAVDFTQAVIGRMHGCSDVVSKAIACYRSWFRVIEDAGRVVDTLRRQRWENDVDDLVEDEETIEERQQLLTRDDPAALSNHLTHLLAKAFGKLSEQLSSLWDAQKEGPNSGAVAAYLLRVLRDIRARLPDHELEKLEQVKNFGLAMVPSLHEALAKAVSVGPLDELSTVTLTRRTVAGRALWEGEPELPCSPSPGAFKFLRNLTVAMRDAGADLWSLAAVAVLKKHLVPEISKAWVEALEGLSSNDNNAQVGESGGEKGSAGEKESNNVTSIEVHHDLLVQWLLDIHYLRLFLGPSEELFKELEDAVWKKTALDKTAIETRLAKTSQDYHKRTTLLFGLLA